MRKAKLTHLFVLETASRASIAGAPQLRAPKLDVLWSGRLLLETVRQARM